MDESQLRIEYGPTDACMYSIHASQQRVDDELIIVLRLYFTRDALVRELFDVAAAAVVYCFLRLMLLLVLFPL